MALLDQEPSASTSEGVLEALAAAVLRDGAESSVQRRQAHLLEAGMSRLSHAWNTHSFRRPNSEVVRFNGPGELARHVHGRHSHTWQTPASPDGTVAMRAKWIASIGLSAALCGTAVQAQAPASVLHLDFKADVQADGSLANVEPDATLTPGLQAMLRKQVAGWRYLPGTWQGKPVPKRVSQRIVAEVVPTPGGGFALRIRQVTGVSIILDTKLARAASTMVPPRYPEGAQRQGIEATLVYAMRRDPQGVPIEVELLDAQVPGNWKKQFDVVGRQAIRSWRLEPFEVEGEAIDCRLLTPMTFRLGEGRSPPPPEPGTDLRPYLPRVPDSCPLPPVLETQVAGVFL